MEWFYYITLLVFVFVGIALNVLTLPGNWVMLLATVLYSWVTGWHYFAWWWLSALVLIAVVGEIVEFFAAGKAAAKLGGSKWGSMGAIVGGLLGGILLTPLIPIFVVGTLIGILIGTFVGSALMELVTGKSVDTSLFIGAGATKGRLIGTLLKVVFGLVMALLIAIRGLPVW